MNRGIGDMVVSNFVKRSISSILIFIVFVLAFYFGPITFYLLFLSVTILGLVELYNFATKRIFFLLSFFIVLLPSASIFYIYTVDKYLVILMFLCVFSTDIFAYIFGKSFGKVKLIPKISPNKTREGAYAGVICSFIVGAIFIFALSLSTTWYYVLPFISILAQLGDVLESCLKRHYNISDSGNLIPGHGGILDRMDSFIIVAPFISILSYYI